MYCNNTLSKSAAPPAICKHAISPKQRRSDDVLLERWQQYKKSTSTSRAHLTTGRQPTHWSFGWPSRNDTAKSAALALLFLAIKNGKSYMHKGKG